MFALTALLVCAVFVGGVAYFAWRARVVFELFFEAGRLARARGRIPQRLLQDIVQAIPQKETTRVVVRCVIEQNHARLSLRGTLGDDTVQQLRNLLGLWPLARLRTAPRLRHPPNVPSDSLRERSRL